MGDRLTVEVTSARNLASEMPPVTAFPVGLVDGFSITR